MKPPLSQNKLSLKATCAVFKSNHESRAVATVVLKAFLSSLFLKQSLHLWSSLLLKDHQDHLKNNPVVRESLFETLLQRFVRCPYKVDDRKNAKQLRMQKS